MSIHVETNLEYRILVEIQGVDGAIPSSFDKLLREKWNALGFVNDIDFLPEDNAYIICCDALFSAEMQIRAVIEELFLS